jgi:hypothetical protein
MPEVVDGSFVTPEGRRKVFVRQRPGESEDVFTTRMMSFYQAMEDGHILERVASSVAEDWERLPSLRWLESSHGSFPKLHIRVTLLESNGGGTVGHLAVDYDEVQVADEWGDEQDEALYLPRSENGYVSNRQAFLWQLAHEIRGIGEYFDQALERSGLVVTG